MLIEVVRTFKTLRNKGLSQVADWVLSVTVVLLALTPTYLERYMHTMSSSGGILLVGGGATGLGELVQVQEYLDRDGLKQQVSERLVDT